MGCHSPSDQACLILYILCPHLTSNRLLCLTVWCYKSKIDDMSNPTNVVINSISGIQRSVKKTEQEMALFVDSSSPPPFSCSKNFCCALIAPRFLKQSLAYNYLHYDFQSSIGAKILPCSSVKSFIVSRSFCILSLISFSCCVF